MTGGSNIKVGEKLDAINEEDEEGSTVKKDMDAEDESSKAHEYDPLEVYHELVFLGRKHGELKVNLGVSIEDLVFGHLSTFEFDRMVCVDGEKERQPERCQLQINVTPGMRSGTQFIFECEGDELPGTIPSDVVVTLQLEPHTRFVCKGDDLATVVHLPLGKALTAAPISILCIGGKALSVEPPKGTIVAPGTVFKCPGEGLPLPHDPSSKGDLYIKCHVHWPTDLEMTSAESEALDAVFAKSQVAMPPTVHDNAEERATNGAATASAVPGLEVEFGSSDPDPSPMLCAQQ